VAEVTENGEKIATMHVAINERPVALMLALLLSALLSGCTRTLSERGLEPTWKTLPEETFVVGSTTKTELLAILGPPSQVITHSGGEIFYYLHEESQSRGLILVVYNTAETDTRYDRAIFFFDANGVLRDFAIKSESPGE
jgi:outer membrane protein assembly factor BamE (lipoprotein component of BamABCDE complex)